MELEVPKPSHNVTDLGNEFLEWDNTRPSKALVTSLNDTIIAPSKLKIASWNCSGSSDIDTRCMIFLHIVSFIKQYEDFDILAFQGLRKKYGKIACELFEKEIVKLGFICSYEIKKREVPILTLIKKRTCSIVSHEVYNDFGCTMEKLNMNHDDIGQFTFINIYRKHHGSWDRLNEIVNPEDPRTIIAGDFNTPDPCENLSDINDDFLISIGDFRQTYRNGNYINPVRRHAYKMCNTGSLEYDDFGFGDYTTWRCRLDHFLVDSEFVDEYIYTVDYRRQKSRMKSSQSHRPILLFLKT